MMQKNPRPGRARALLQAGFIALLTVLFMLPMALHLAGRSANGTAENRPLAPWPGLPRADAALTAWPPLVDAWLGDHFGLRTALVRTAHRVRHAVFGEFISPQVVAGRHGRLFLGSHSADHPFLLIHRSCGWGVTEPEVAALAQQITVLLGRAAAAGLPTDVLIVPSAAPLYPQDLPLWLARQCDPAGYPAPRVAALLSPALRDHLHYPLAVMADPGLPQPAIPRTNFHWAGVGPDRAETWLAEQRLHLPRLHEIPATVAPQPSDISQFFPGVRLASPQALPDAAAAGLEACIGPPCFPELGSGAAKLGDLRRYRGNAQGGGRLLLLTDSFGAAGAVWFARHFGEVLQVSTNNLEQLSAPELARFRQALLTEYRPDQLVLLYHDDGLYYFWDRLMRLVFPQG